MTKVAARHRCPSTSQCTTPAWRVTFDDGKVELVVAPAFDIAADHAIEQHATHRWMIPDGSYMATWRRAITKIERV